MEGGKTHPIGNKKSRTTSIYKDNRGSPAVKLFAHQAVLDEDFRRRLHKGMGKNVTQGGV